MTTECNGKLFEFHPLGRREVRADFKGGEITSDAGELLLQEVEKRMGIIEASLDPGIKAHFEPFDFRMLTVVRLNSMEVSFAIRLCAISK